MLGTGLRKMAKELGLKQDQGVAYGEYLGYNITLSEGAGWKFLGISARAPEESRVNEFLNRILPDDKTLRKNFRVSGLNVLEDAVTVTFSDNPGTMAKYRDFTNWILPQLTHAGFRGAEVCPLCGGPVGPADPWKLEGAVAGHVHAACASAVEVQSASLADQIRAEDTGSYALGFLGALAGAVLGAIPWAVALYFGFFVSMLGFVIGYLAQKGYELANGRIGKGKIAIVIVTAFIGVILGNVFSDVMILGSMIRTGEFPGATFADLPTLMGLAYTDVEYMKEFFINLALGFVFALLGMYGMIRAMRDTDPTNARKLKDIQQA